MAGVRIDKWLWAVRLFKTRSLAADACKGGHVRVNGQHVKPAREVHLGEILQARIGHITRTVRVTGLIDQRVSAPLARENAVDLTPPEELAKPREPDSSRGIARPKGMGRPTKKDRRALEQLEMTNDE